MASPDLIVGLGHKKRVGKDTFAGFLAEELEALGYETLKIAFAYDMKEIAKSVFGLYGLQCGYYYEKHAAEREIPLARFNKSPRQIWIEFARAMRDICPDIWVDHLANFMNEYRDYGKRPCAFIITDVRFPHEVRAIKSWGGKLIKITRPAAPYSNVPSETALDSFGGWDYYVNNNGSMHDLSGIASCAADFLHNKPNWKGN